MKHNSKALLAGILLGILVVLATGAVTNYDTGTVLSRSTLLSDTLTVTTATVTTGNVTTANIATAATTATIVATSLTNNGIDVRPSTAASVTSPTVTVSAAGATVISVTTDESQTGMILTGGTQWQVVIIRGTNDSATMQVDDGTASMTLSGNATLGLDDTLTLLCTSADGDEWAQLAVSAN